MFGIGTSELIVLGVLGVIVLSIANRFADYLRERQQLEKQPPRNSFVELVTKPREPSMTQLLKKFLWSPAFWASLGIIGLTTGVYFQRVAENGAGLWCMGLLFLGAAYLEQSDV